MRYVNSITGQYPYTYEQIIASNPNTLFPPCSDFKPPHPYCEVEEVDKPAFDATTQQVIEVAPQLVNGTWTRTWEVVEIFSTQEERDVALSSAQEAAALNVRQSSKAARAAAVDAIKVTTASGKTFDGDETSQNRMARAIVALNATGTAETLWVLADNTPVQVTAAELAEALALSGAAQAALWVI